MPISEGYPCSVATTDPNQVVHRTVYPEFVDSTGNPWLISNLDIPKATIRGCDMVPRNYYFPETFEPIYKIKNRLGSNNNSIFPSQRIRK